MTLFISSVGFHLTIVIFSFLFIFCLVFLFPNFVSLCSYVLDLSFVNRTLLAFVLSFGVISFNSELENLAHSLRLIYFYLFLSSCNMHYICCTFPLCVFFFFKHYFFGLISLTLASISLEVVDSCNGYCSNSKIEPDILECEVKQPLRSITMNKASGGDRIPAELFQNLRDDAVKVLQSIC